MPFSLHSSLSFASMELWKVLFKVFVQNANDKSLVFASASCVSAAASEASAAAVVSVLLEELHPASIAAIMQTERPAAVNLRLFFINLILLLLHHCLVHFKRIVIVFFLFLRKNFSLWKESPCLISRYYSIPCPFVNTLVAYCTNFSDIFILFY